MILYISCATKQAIC